MMEMLLLETTIPLSTQDCDDSDATNIVHGVATSCDDSLYTLALSSSTTVIQMEQLF